jgi:FkbM family methyltransferase
LKFNVQPSMGLTYAFGRGMNDDFFCRAVKPGMTVLDVGANVGHMALLFSRLVGPGGRVISIEPMPHLADVLKANLARNRLLNVDVVNAAATDEIGRAPFVFNERSPTTGRLVEFRGPENDQLIESVEVATITLDSLGIEPDFIKIDVEGTGDLVFRGASKTLSAKPILYFELHGTKEKLACKTLHYEHGYQFFGFCGKSVQPWINGRRAVWAH